MMKSYMYSSSAVRDLDSNALTGTIPDQIGVLAELTWLYLYDNALTGTIPARLGGLAKAGYLGLSTNRLSGTIPTELEDLPALVELYLRGNPTLSRYCQKLYPIGGWG